MTRLRVITPFEGLPVYELPLGAMLSHHEWWPFSDARLITPAFPANVPEHLQGFSMRLWSYAMNRGDPVGTLPAIPRELGAIFGKEDQSKSCEELRTVCLWDWTEHVCRDDAGGREAIRLAHPVFTKLAREAWERAQRKPQCAQERSAQQHARRVRDHLQRIHGGRMARCAQTVERITEALKARGVRLTLENVRDEAERLSMPTEAELKPTEAN